MSVESATYINQLNASYPAASDPKSEGDNHVRLLKSTLQATFPNLTATAVTPTSTDFNTLAGAATTGAVGLNVETQAVANNSTKAASTAFVSAAVAAATLSATLPSQSGNGGKYIYTDGTNAGWYALGGPVTVVSGTTQTAVAGNHYILTNVASSTVTLPASPASGDTVWVTWANSLATNVIARNAQTIMGDASDMTLDASTNGTVQLRFVNSSWRLM